ncbi:MAG: F0F1 ATP synthase subunit delta [uncultured bacterium]|nr:MAG: F0F1 ATP synthase subunit delta [uncultured bacterium]
MKINIKQYSQTLFDLTDGKSDQEVLDVVGKFAQTLKKDGQVKNAGMIMRKFSEMYNGANGIVEAEVTTRYKIQDTRYKEIEDFIKSKYKAESVEITSIVNESIKGGIIVKVGDEIFDASVNGQLKKLHKILIK